VQVKKYIREKYIKNEGSISSRLSALERERGEIKKKVTRGISDKLVDILDTEEINRNQQVAYCL
jgi:hypothetical protein